MRRGFTIVELLTVVSIVALLLGVAALSLSGVRAAGRGARCRAQLRQMALGATQYAQQYQYFPPALRYEQGAAGLEQHAWDWVTTFDGRVLGAGSLWGFTAHPDEALQCPEYHSPSNFSGDPFTGYNYNTSYLGGEASFPQLDWQGYRFGITYAQVSRASACAIFGDGGWSAGANKFMRAPENRQSMPLSVIYAGGQAFRHRHATNVAFVDGHVSPSSDPRPGTHATPDLLERIMGHPVNGFLSDDDRAYRPR